MKTKSNVFLSKGTLEVSQGSIPSVKVSRFVAHININFHTGLAKSLDSMREVFALCIRIVNNSGLMQKPDGHQIIPTKDQNMMGRNCGMCQPSHQNGWID